MGRSVYRCLTWTSERTRAVPGRTYCLLEPEDLEVSSCGRLDSILRLPDSRLAAGGARGIWAGTARSALEVAAGRPLHFLG
ncbi:hypothetical protein NDU88_003981 [Pleurodeles waltl]|uniref:Uncharacterized protein n=1 Tax=Pleurodeles waltl TaxID=8319 RepID=A0AAV7PG57_PLEWA|nr:hypothetical protein NDU88_003981 [Pleurodeles waltl]